MFNALLAAARMSINVMRKCARHRLLVLQLTHGCVCHMCDVDVVGGGGNYLSACLCAMSFVLGPHERENNANAICTRPQ